MRWICMFDLQSILWMLEIKSNENNYKLLWQTLSGLDKRVEQLTGQKMMDSDHNLAFLPCQNRTDDKVNTHVKPHLAHTDIEEPFYLIFLQFGFGFPISNPFSDWDMGEPTCSGILGKIFHQLGKIYGKMIWTFPYDEQLIPKPWTII